MVWGEPADKVVRALDLAREELRGENPQAREFLERCGTARVGEVRDLFMIVMPFPDAKVEAGTHIAFQISALPSMEERQITTELKEWASDLCPRHEGSPGLTVVTIRKGGVA